MRQSQSDLNESSFYSCAKDYTMCSDSCVCLAGEKYISILCNGTNNYGILGSSLVSIYDSKPGTFVKFNKVYKCFDMYFIEFVRSSYIASFCDFVDISGQERCFCVLDAIATFEKCIFIDALGKEISRFGTTVINYINCSSNVNFQSMNLTSIDKMNYQRTFYYNQLVCNNGHCSKLYPESYPYLHIVMLFVLC